MVQTATIPPLKLEDLFTIIPITVKNYLTSILSKARSAEPRAARASYRLLTFPQLHSNLMFGSISGGGMKNRAAATGDSITALPGGFPSRGEVR